MSAPKKAGDLIARLEQVRTRQGSRAAEDAPTPTEQPRGQVVQLPPWPEALRAIPNHLARSSLFAPIARGRRKIHDGIELASRSDVRILFSGKQLDEADCDVWMQALHEARCVPLGQPVLINRAEFLRAIGRSTGKKDYEWLYSAFDRLAFAMLSIRAKHYTIGGTPRRGATRSEVMHLVDGFSHDPDLGTYVLRLDPRMVLLFSNREFAQIDWDKRLRIEHQTDMAKWLQRLVATSSDRIQRHSLDELKERMQYSGHMRNFRAALKTALAELARLKIIAKPRIELSTRGVEQSVWTRLGPVDLDCDDRSPASG